ncbi:ExbD/TolR family protein [Epilithonimonas mollis]|uniref:Biopolymer transport protein ExbD n=1 Tax=Epilithonimonas mollis TaxID=216903 RepID=A0A1M6NIP6_9FLAO|nr:biopolymer transporter ExbD [Epilithonimonas mollis]SHJ95601.1 Biopolymer transport protein ExbD [Epilithonimonas mollis]
MAEVQIKEQSTGKKTQNKKPIRVDMTPMVDLGFLLITFFMFTTNFSKPNVMNVGLPAKGPINTTEVDVKNSISFILGQEGRVFYYQADKKDLTDKSLKEISFDKAQVAKTIEAAKANAKDKNIFTVIVKPADDSQYKTVVDMLDELAITKSERYGIAEMNDREKELYQKRIE